MKMFGMAYGILAKNIPAPRLKNLSANISEFFVHGKHITNMHINQTKILTISYTITIILLKIKLSS